MSFGPIRRMNLSYIAGCVHVAVFDVTCFPVFVHASDVISSILSTHPLFYPGRHQRATTWPICLLGRKARWASSPRQRCGCMEFQKPYVFPRSHVKQWRMGSYFLCIYASMSSLVRIWKFSKSVLNWYVNY